MTINLNVPATHELKPRITVFGVGGAGGNAVNNMITSHLEGVEFVIANTDAQAIAQSLTERRIQLGSSLTQGLGAGARRSVVGSLMGSGLCLPMVGTPQTSRLRTAEERAQDFGLP